MRRTLQLRLQRVKFSAVILFFVFLVSGTVSQELPALKLKSKNSVMEVSTDKHNSVNLSDVKLTGETFQLKKRKTVSSYFGAGYSFVIFTNSQLNEIYPILDTRNGGFLTNIGVFFGFAIAQAVTLEFEPSLLFTNSTKSIKTSLGRPHTPNSNDTVAYSSNLSLFSLPLALNVRFFPFFKLSSYARLFFIGGGVGYQWIKEDYDNTYSSNPNLPPGYYGYGGISESTSQWTPTFRVMAGVTGTGGQFGFGGEIRYNIVPLKEETGTPFRTRTAGDFNSVDIVLRFYFSL